MNRDHRFELFLFLAAVGLAIAGYGWPQWSSSGWELSPPDSTGLRVVTWNVGGASGLKGRGLADEHLDHIATELQALEPDIVVLQEVRDESQLRRLVQGSQGANWRGFGITPRGGRRVAILVREGRVRYRQVGLDGGRDALMAECRFDGKPALVVLGLHADAYDAQVRNRQIGRAVDRLQRRDRDVRILAGDFNLDVDLDKRRELFTTNDQLDVDAYNYVADRLVDAATGTGSTAEPDRRLDYVFVSGGTLEVVSAGPYRGKRIGDMDHDPVVADLRFR